MNPQFNNYMAPADSESGGSITSEPAEDTFELLNEEEVEKPETLDISDVKEPKDDDDEDEKDEEVDELKELEDELKPPTEEDLLEIVSPARRKEILAKYPKLFKDFPYLEKAYYRDQQFTEILPTVQDARLAVEKARILDNTEREVMDGNITSILRAARSESQEAFNKIADNYLPALRAVDQQAYYHVLGNVVKDTIITMAREGKNLGDNGAPLLAAANILNQFVFGSQTFTPPQQLARQVNPNEQAREQQLNQQEQQRFYQQFETVKDELQTKADNVLKSTIDGHIDPNGTMSDYVKSHATKEAFENLEVLISKDTRFRSLLDKLWEKAFQSNFDKETTAKIKSAYLSKAKTLLPSVIKKARNDALRGRAARVEKDEPLIPRRNPTEQSAAPSKGGKIRKASDIPRGMSTLDVLMKD